jgi:glutaminyl-tRNA synthetase
VDCELRIYDRLFSAPSPGAGDRDFLDDLNSDSLQIKSGCKGEISLASASVNEHYQFEREGYFYLDSRYSSEAKPVFNQTIGLKDSWSKGQ